VSYNLNVAPEVIAAIREEFKKHVVRYGGRSRFPLQPREPEGSRPLCTGCHKEVPKYRRSWCSDACYARYVPACVSRQVANRDKGICQGCGHHIPSLYAEWKKQEPPGLTREFSDACWRRGVRPWETPEHAAWNKAMEEWRALMPREEYDHIIPFSEGGLTIVENMRTLCSPCHRKRTREWHAEKKEARKSQKSLEHLNQQRALRKAA
jgi:hypothetical protein